MCWILTHIQEAIKPDLFHFTWGTDLYWTSFLQRLQTVARSAPGGALCLPGRDCSSSLHDLQCDTPELHWPEHRVRQQWRSCSNSEHELVQVWLESWRLFLTPQKCLPALWQTWSNLPLLVLNSEILESGKTYLGRLQSEVLRSRAVAKYHRGSCLKHCGSSSMKEQPHNSGLLSSIWELSEWANAEIETNTVQRENTMWQCDTSDPAWTPTGQGVYFGHIPTVARGLWSVGSVEPGTWFMVPWYR